MNTSNKVFTMVFDTETTGLPSDKLFRMVELGYALYDDTGKIVSQYSSLVIPEGFEIPNPEIHGVSTEIAVKFGRPLIEVLTQFGRDLQRTKRIVAHNFVFDEKVIIRECALFEELGWVADLLTKTEFYCTCYNGAFKFYGPGYDRIRLVELYKRITGKIVEQDHRAMADVEMCATCYFNLIGVIKL